MRTKQLLTKTLLLLAVMLMGAGTAWAADETITFSSLYSSNTILDDEPINGTNFSILFEKRTNGTATQYYTNGTAVRWYGGGKMTVSSTTKTIEKIEITFTQTANTVTTNVGSYKDGTWTGTANTVVFSQSGTTGHCRISSVAVTYASNLTKCDLALTDAPIELSFDLYNNSSAQIINYTTSSTGDVTVSESDYITTSVDQINKTITVTPKTSVTPSVQTITVSQAANDDYAAGSATFTVTIDDSTPLPTHAVTFSVNGTTTTQDFEEGAAITFPSNPADIEGKTFVGWTASAINGVTDEVPTFVTSASMGTEALTFYAVFAEKTAGTQTTVTDVLTSAITGVTGTGSYSDWSGKTVTSDAVYTGNSAKSATDAIQIRSNNSNSGIVSTTSGGTLKSVTVTWTDGNISGRSLDIYGSNTAYTEATELYDSKKQGTKLGSVTYNTSSSLTVSGDYAYVGLRSNNGAIYLADISIEWTTGTPDTYSAYCTTVAADTREEAGISFAEATVTKEIVDNYTGQTLTNPNNISPITWTSTNETVATVEDGTVTVLAVGETTIKASFAGNDTYKKAEVSYTLTVQDSRTAPGYSFSASTAEAILGEAFTAPTFSNPNNVAVTFESSDENVATIDQSGNVTPLAAGTTTIKASSEATNAYFADEVSYTLTVIDPNAPGTENNPYTVAQARAAIDAGTGVTGVYATGIVSKIVTAYSSAYGNISYNISADGSTTADQLQAFRGFSYNGDYFTSADDIQVGDVVVIYGNLKKHTDGTYEFEAGNQLVSLDRPISTTPSIEVSDNTIEATADGADGTITVTYNNITDVAAEVYFCNANGEAASYDWIQAEINNENNLYYLIDANDGAARTAYMKVYALDDDAQDVYSELITINQAEFVVDYAELPFEFDGGKADIATTSGLTQEGLGSDYSSSPKLKFDGTDDYVILKINERPGKLTFDIKGNTFSDGTFTVQTSADGEYYTDLATYTELGTTQSEEFNNLAEDVRYIKWIYTEKVNGNVALGNIKLAAYVDTPEPQQYTLTVEPFENLEIITFVNDEMVMEEDGDIQVNEGDQIMLSIAASEGYVMETLMVNGVNHVNDIADDFTYSFEMPDEDVTISATAVEYIAPNPGEWVLTDLEDLTEDDVFVIVGDNGDTYAMSNDEGTQNPPAAVAVTVVDNTLSGTIDDNLMWNVSGDEDGYTFYPNGNHEVWLYCTNANNGVRVGTNANNIFKVNDGYLVHDATSRYVGIYNSLDWRCYTSYTGNSNIANQTFSFYKKVSTEEKESITISAAGYATYCSENALDFSNTGLTAYKAIMTDSEVSFTPVTEVPAEEGVLLKGVEGTYSVPVIASTTADFEDNAFIGYTDETVVNEKGIYVLMDPHGGKGVGFYKTTTDSFTLSAHTAYLPALAGGNGARTFIGLDEATAIEGIAAERANNGEIFNLQGQRVTKAQKGLYIMDGKKVVIK